MELPIPFPNIEVKHFSVDDSCGATCRENRSLPGYYSFKHENMSSPDQCSEFLYSCLFKCAQWSKISVQGKKGTRQRVTSFDEEENENWQQKKLKKAPLRIKLLGVQ